jgi:predicted transposase/invertase (TIGR01784 family)
MIYLDPKSDVAFKKLFGNMAHKNILISFLNSVLERSETAQIIDVVINDPANVPDNISIKYSIVDVRCTDQNGHKYIVEMQIVREKDYAARAQYYSALTLSKQLAPRGGYDELVPVYFIGILDFKLFEESDYLTHHLILNKKTHTQSLKHLEFHFIELNKFNKTETQLNNILDKWIFFLKNADLLPKIPTALQQPNFTDAFDLLAQSNWSNQEMLQYEKYLDALRSQVSQIETAIEDGRQEGRQEGKVEKAAEIAQKMLAAGTDISIIAELTDLSIAQIKAFKKNN